jgi:hypothetical protein
MHGEGGRGSLDVPGQVRLQEALIESSATGPCHLSKKKGTGTMAGPPQSPALAFGNKIQDRNHRQHWRCRCRRVKAKLRPM